MKYLALASLGLILCGCGDDTKYPLAPHAIAQVPSRFSVTTAGIFKSSDQRWHDIVILKDEETGQEYVCVQGFGSPQLVSENHGKTHTTVDR